jgi:uncharacterized protein YkwD
MKHSSVKPPHHLHVVRVILFALLLLAFFLVKSVSAGSQQAAQTSQQVLAYATNVSISGLLSATNSYRAQNGLGALSLNSQLNSSSQSKAQHMIANNYWSHVAPDGTQPWYFFNQAGYSYAAAGENLAYGFDSSQGTVDAWMASPSHKANVLGSYVDVGFGIANGENYQGNQNTVIVAHYGTPQAAPAPAPTPAPTSTTTPKPTTTPAPSTPVPTEPAAPASETASEPQTTEDTVVNEPKETTIKPVSNTIPVAAAASKDISLMESLRQRQAPLMAIAGIGLTVAAAGGFVMTHRRLFHHALATGENFVIHHPAFDFATVAVVTALILTTTISRIG